MRVFLYRCNVSVIRCIKGIIISINILINHLISYNIIIEFDPTNPLFVEIVLSGEFNLLNGVSSSKEQDTSIEAITNASTNLNFFVIIFRLNFLYYISITNSPQERKSFHFILVFELFLSQVTKKN